VGYDLTPAALNQAGERRYTLGLLEALRARTDLEVAELSLTRRKPSVRVQRVAYQLVAEGVYYPLLLGAMARRAGVDLVHHPRNLVPPEPTLTVPSVVTVHDVLPLSEPQHFSRSIRLRHPLLTRSAVRAAALVLTVSEHSARDIAEHLGVAPERIRVIHSGVERRFRPVEPDRERLERELGVRSPYVLCVGTLEPRKNLAAAVLAFERVQARFPDHSLVLIGGHGWLGEELERTLSETHARVVKPGRVSDERLVELYSGAECFLFPSLSEGFGFPVLEAMACGAPVVASDRASLPEVVGDAGALVEPTDPDALAEAVVRLLESPERRAEARRRGLERAARFTWERCAEATVAAYRDALR
jgi:glycosyltransferase involved in cell wall biosynthesis